MQLSKKDILNLTGRHGSQMKGGWWGMRDKEGLMLFVLMSTKSQSLCTYSSICLQAAARPCAFISLLAKMHVMLDESTSLHACNQPLTAITTSASQRKRRCRSFVGIVFDLLIKTDGKKKSGREREKHGCWVWHHTERRSANWWGGSTVFSCGLVCG